MSQEIIKLEVEYLGLTENEPQATSLPLDQNPAAVYLSTLRPKGRRAMLHGLNVIAALLREKSEALTFPWHQVRYQHTTAVVSALRDKGYRPASINNDAQRVEGCPKCRRDVGADECRGLQAGL